jgi:hypothetical protein
MDGLGLGLEGYDHTGRYRTMEGTKPASGRGEIVGTGSSLDGPFDDAVALAGRLAGAPQVEQCFVRQQFRYLFGRDEAELDTCALAAAYEASQKSGGDFGEVVLSLLSSDAFVFRNAR